MKKHGYVTNLYQTACELGYHIETYELFHASPEDRNPSGIVVIRKNPVPEDGKDIDCPFACPISKKNMGKYENFIGEIEYYCPESMLAYPVSQGIPCLLPNNAVVATKYLENFDKDW